MEYEQDLALQIDEIPLEDDILKRDWRSDVIYRLAFSTKNAVDKNGEKRRNIVGKPVKTFCARVKTGWVNIKVGSVIKFITA